MGATFLASNFMFKVTHVMNVCYTFSLPESLIKMNKNYFAELVVCKL